ncbi:transglutaminase family protein [Chelatococcus sambhunathii]|uniref:Transglutaminase family protein n=1 Tax=Chelatococcus sambhunathii TaxID=363953 RepID=A0ABU1DEU4_9HYPH|nr:transglutaminase family protein [Chelatococcus sambhunathii]MDR4306638.1 transglutaminase family protein [Chelatococcus sambhunathii]
MNYEITLEISYDYPNAVKDARHILRVRPRAEPGQRVTAVSLAVSPKPSEAINERDFFGNQIDHVFIQPSHDEMTVTMKAKVSVGRGALDLDATPSVGELIDVAHAARLSVPSAPMHFLGDSRIVRAMPALTGYAMDALDMSAPSGAAILAFAKRIQKEFKYAPGATEVDTPLEEAFRRKEGVCQDFAHVMIAALRGMGVPAAYVSGYIRTIPPPGKRRLEGADAMHAWVAVWLGAKTGWRGFDPTNGILALNDHIVVASGRDYSDVAPIDGVLITAGPHTTKHSVDVKPIGEFSEPGVATAIPRR